MLLRPVQPLSARAWFKSRIVVNYAAITALFAVAVTLGSAVLSLLNQGILAMLVLDGLSLTGAYCLHLVLEKRPFYIACECREVISTNTPWVCGVCKRLNKSTAVFPFVNRCGYSDCGTEPKAYRCHHCGGLVYLTKDLDSRNYAHALNTPGDVSEAELRDQAVAKRKQRLEDNEREIARKEQQMKKVEMNARLKEVRKRARYRNEPEPPAEKRLDDFVNKHTEIERLAREKKAANRRNITNRAELRKANRAVDEFVRSELAKLREPEG